MYKIYLLECIDNDKNVYKIGYTSQDVNTRLRQLKTGNSHNITLIATYETQYGSKLETAIHNYFKIKKNNREWFNLDLEDVLNFKDVCRKIENNFIILSENHHFKKYIKK